MKRLILGVGCLLVLSSSPVLAQTEPEIAVVRVVESVSKVRISIARGSAAPEYVEFDGGLSSKDAPQVAVSYQRVMAKLYAEGYVLQGSIGSYEGEAFNSRALLFVKAPKP